MGVDRGHLCMICLVFFTIQIILTEAKCATKLEITHDSSSSLLPLKPVLHSAPSPLGLQVHYRIPAAINSYRC